MPYLCSLELLHVVFGPARKVDPFSPLRWQGFDRALLETATNKPVEGP